jgi:phage terminase small subunit
MSVAGNGDHKISLNPELQQKLCAFIRAGASRETAAKACGLTLSELREALDMNQELAAEIEKAEMDVIAATEIQLRQRDPKAWLRERSTVHGPEPCLPAKNSIEVAPGRLTARQERFVHEYPKDCNGTQAAIRAGYAEKSAEVQATRLLGDPKILRQLRQVQGRALRRADITADRVLREYAAIGFFDPAEIFDDQGQLLAVREMPAGARQAIAGIEIEELHDRGGRSIGRLHKLRFAPKVPALDALAQHLGILKPLSDEGRSDWLSDLRRVLEMWEERRRVEQPVENIEVAELPVTVNGSGPHE